EMLFAGQRMRQGRKKELEQPHQTHQPRRTRTNQGQPRLVIPDCEGCHPRGLLILCARGGGMQGHNKCLVSAQSERKKGGASDAGQLVWSVLIVCTPFSISG